MPTATATDNQLDRDASALYDALSELIRVYQFRDRDRICCHDLSVTQCYALEALSRTDGMTINDLSARLYLDKSTTSRVVNALQRKGYAVRAIDPDDGRVTRLGLTPAGSKLHEQIHGEIVNQEKELLRDFESETRQALAQLIRRLADAAAARVETTGGACCVRPGPA
jgi:DNA-binding MarR family transcriptional regulator